MRLLLFIILGLLFATTAYAVGENFVGLMNGQPTVIEDVTDSSTSTEGLVEGQPSYLLEFSPTPTPAPNHATLILRQGSINIRNGDLILR